MLVKPSLRSLFSFCRARFFPFFFFFAETTKQNKQPAFPSFQPSGIVGVGAPNATIDIPPTLVGWVIGKAGIRINEMQQRTSATVSMRSCHVFVALLVL